MKNIFIIMFIVVAAQAAVSGFAVDIHSFRGDSQEGSLVEVVWSINRGGLALERVDSIWADSVLFDIEIKRGGEIVHEAALKRIIEIPRGEMVTRDFLLFDKSAVILQPGEYRLFFTAVDLGDEDSHSSELDFTVPQNTAGLDLSEIALFSDVAIDTMKSQFSFGGIRMLPNPASVFGISFPTMFVYIEAYDASAGETLEVIYSILDSYGAQVKAFEPIRRVTSEGATPILNGLNVLGLPEGNYFIRLSIASVDTKKVLFKEKRFSVSKSQDRPTAKTFRPDTNNIDIEYSYIHYLISTSDRRLFERLTPEGKAEFLVRWWEDRDPDPRTPENEYRTQVLDRWNLANSTFGENGWKTDRGRVFILYGPPDNIERSQFTLDSNPWEQWDYFSLQGGVYFIFADERGIGNYRLVHSTAPGEPFDTSWLSKLSNPHGTSREIEK